MCRLCSPPVARDAPAISAPRKGSEMLPRLSQTLFTEMPKNDDPFHLPLLGGILCAPGLVFGFSPEPHHEPAFRALSYFRSNSLVRMICSPEEGPTNFGRRHPINASFPQSR